MTDVQARLDKTPDIQQSPSLLPPSHNVVLNQPSSNQPSAAENIGPMTIKQILARLDGVFPMDDAIIEGNPHLNLISTTPL